MYINTMSIKHGASLRSQSSVPGKKLILLAIDPSDCSEYAFDWFVRNLHHPEHELMCLHVPEGFDVEKAQKEFAKGGQMKESLEKQYSLINELEEKYRHKLHDAKVRGSVMSVTSKPAGVAILDAAAEEGAVCIVMGTRGRSKLKKAFSGSVSDHVVKNSDIPVIVVRKKE